MRVPIRQRQMMVDGKVVYYVMHPKCGRTKLPKEKVVDGVQLYFLVPKKTLALFKKGIMEHIPRFAPYGLPLNPSHIAKVQLDNCPDVNHAMFSEFGEEPPGDLYRVDVAFDIGKLEGFYATFKIKEEEDGNEPWMN